MPLAIAMGVAIVLSGGVALASTGPATPDTRSSGRVGETVPARQVSVDIEVHPDSRLHDGQSVELSGGGFAPNATLEVSEFQIDFDHFTGPGAAIGRVPTNSNGEI